MEKEKHLRILSSREHKIGRSVFARADGVSTLASVHLSACVPFGWLRLPELPATELVICEIKKGKMIKQPAEARRRARSRRGSRIHPVSARRADALTYFRGSIRARRDAQARVSYVERVACANGDTAAEKQST